MIRVLLVDDELLVLSYLKTLIHWEQHGYQIVGEFNNGREAMAEIRTHPPDIIILDVSMPLMDGIEVTRYIHEHRLDIQIIMLSSYDEYDYVRESMKNGAADYLLKHRLTDHELLRALRRASDNIRREAAGHDPAPAGNKEEETLKTLILRPAGEWDIARFPGLEKRIRNSVLVVMQINDYIFLSNKYTDSERYGLKQSVMNFGAMMMKDVERGLMIYLDQGRYVALFPVRSISSLPRVSEYVGEHMTSFCNAVHRYLNIHMTWAQSPLCLKPADIAAGYSRLSSELDTRRAPAAVSPSVPGSALPVISFIQEKKIFSYIADRNLCGIRKIADDLFSSSSSHPPDVSELQIVVSELITIANKVCDSYHIDFREICDIHQLVFDTTDNVRGWIMALFERLTDRLNRTEARSAYSACVTSAIRFIQENYIQNISLADVSDRINVNYTYLSHTFKAETGKTFVEYLNQLRVEKAISLIREENCKISSIYKQVGFNSYNYFFLVFKNITGNTPRDYMARAQQSHTPGSAVSS